MEGGSVNTTRRREVGTGRYRCVSTLALSCCSLCSAGVAAQASSSPASREEASPDEISDAFYREGAAAYRRGDWAEAERLLTLSLERANPHWAVHYTLGATLVRNRQWRAAEDHLEQARELAPDEVRPRWLLAYVKLRLGDYHQTCDLLDGLDGSLLSQPSQLGRLRERAWCREGGGSYRSPPGESAGSGRDAEVRRLREDVSHPAFVDS